MRFSRLRKPSRPRRFWLHVGAPKTGTNYLEKILWGNQDRLLRAGVWMPGKAVAHHDALMGEVRGGVWQHRDPAWTWSRVIKEAGRHHHDVLVTKEMFAGAEAEQAAHIRDLVAGLRNTEFHVILTVRELAGLLPSSWQQSVKARMAKPFGEWITDLKDDPQHGFWRHQDPISILSRWAPDLPAEQVHVITTPPSPADSTLLWSRFAETLGIDPAGFELPGDRPNESMGAVEAETLRRVNAHLGSALPMRKPYLDGIRKQLTHPVLLPRGNAARFAVPSVHTEWMTRRSAELIAALEAYPCHLVGSVEDLRARPRAGQTSPDEVSSEEIIDSATDAIAKILTRTAVEDGRVDV